MRDVRIDRRKLLFATASGLLLPSTPLLAQTAADKPALLVVYLKGGYNSLFGSANSFVGRGDFGVTNQNMLALGNDLVVDSSLGVLSPFAKQHIATVGVRHGISNHGGAAKASFSVDGRNPLLMLAAGMGGSAAIKAVSAGADAIPGPGAPESGVSMQQINDIQSAIEALGGGIPDPNAPERELAFLALQASQGMSQTNLIGNPRSLFSARTGYGTAVDGLGRPPEILNPAEISAAYKLTGTAIGDFKSKIAAAELMIRGGSNVVTVSDSGWDTHSDLDGQDVRGMMNTRIMPAIKIFTDRLLEAQGRNVVVVILAEFARSLPGSDHAAVSTVTVIGKNVKVGTTGKVDANVELPEGTPSVPGLWGYVGSVLRVPDSVVKAMGGNPHTRIT